jgi:replicative DNA helicase
MRRACHDGLHGLYCSGEMFAYHLASRGLATDADVPRWKMRRPEELNTDEKKLLGEAALRQCSTCTILDGELSTARIRIAARRKHRKGELQLIVIDYDELVDAPGANDLERQKNVVRAAKRMSMQLAVPVILVSQLNKDLKEGEMITLDRLYGSGKKVKDASYVLYIDRPWVQKLEGDETAAKIIIMKARDGRMAVIPCNFNIKTLRHEGNPVEESWQRATKSSVIGPQSQERPPYTVADSIQDDPEPPDEESS